MCISLRPTRAATSRSSRTIAMRSGSMTRTGGRPTVVKRRLGVDRGRHLAGLGLLDVQAGHRSVQRPRVAILEVAGNGGLAILRYPGQRGLHLPHRPQCRPHPARAGSCSDRSYCRLIVFIERLPNEDPRHRVHPWGPRARGASRRQIGLGVWPGSATIEMARLAGEVARLTGFNRADDIYIRIPVEGAGDWLTSSESA
jgi:hypothetical protein